jgi:hypothetical protein
LELHQRGTARALRKAGDGPIHAATLGIYLRLDELAALAAWWLSETDPFMLDESGRLTVQAVVEQYRGILRDQAALLRQMGTQRFQRPDPSAVFAQALAEAVDATPRREIDAAASTSCLDSTITPDPCHGYPLPPEDGK